MNQVQLSARAYHRILKLNSPFEFSRWLRTIDDLAGSEGVGEDAVSIGPSHLAEALQYRPRILTVCVG
jgi:predicted ATPase with chaperone activity